MIFVIHILLLLIVVCSGRVSFTANGDWKAASDSKICEERYLCTPEGVTWHPDYPNELFGQKNGCDMLQNQGITTIFFYGDSYMRHLYQAMSITLREDYKQGSMGDSHGKPAECQYTEQLTLAICVDNDPQKVCGGNVTLLYAHERPVVFDEGDCATEAGNVYFWSEGNHPIPTQNRNSVNNFWAYGDMYESLVCPSSMEYWESHPEEDQMDHHKYCSVWWVSTHFRYTAYYPQETVERVLEYNNGMRAFFDGVPGGRPDPEQTSSCKGINYVDVYNMTKSLVTTHREVALQMTYDQVHWSMEVNLVKAQILLNALSSSG